MPPRRSRRQLGDATGERGEADLVGVGGRQGDLDAGDHLGDAPGHLDQAEADRIELGIAPERCPRRQAAQAQQQPVGGGVDQQAELVGGRLGAGGAVGGEVQLVRLDQVFGLSPGAVDLLVERLGQARQIGDDEAAVGALGSGLDAGDDAALDLPAGGGVAEVAVAADLVGLAVDPAERGILGEIDRPGAAAPRCRRGRRCSRCACVRTTPWPRAGA